MIEEILISWGPVGVVMVIMLYAMQTQKSYAIAEQTQAANTGKLATSIDSLTTANNKHASAASAQADAMHDLKEEIKRDRDNRIMQHQQLMDAFNSTTIGIQTVMGELVTQVRGFGVAADSMAKNSRLTETALKELTESVRIHTKASHTDATLLSAQTAAVTKMTKTNQQLIDQLGPIIEEIQQMRRDIQAFRNGTVEKANQLDNRVTLIENQLTGIAARSRPKPKTAAQKKEKSDATATKSDVSKPGSDDADRGSDGGVVRDNPGTGSL